MDKLIVMSLGFSNMNHLPSGAITSTHVDNINPSVRVGSTRLPYLDYNRDFRVTSDLDEEEAFAQTVRLKTLVPDIPQQLLESSMDHGGEGLEDNNISYSSSSPFARDLGWSFFVPNGVSASFFSSTSGGVGGNDSSPLVLTPDRNHPSSAASSSSSEFLRSFLKLHQKWVDDRILEYGSIVFRGFGDLEDAAGSSRETAAIGKEILRAFAPRNNNNNNNDNNNNNNNSEDNSSSPSLDARKRFEYYLVSETGGSEPESLSSVRRSTDVVSSRTKRAGPTQQRLTEISARTRLTDWRGIYDDLPKKLRRKLNEKRLLYKRRTHLVPAASPEILLPFHGSSSVSSREMATIYAGDEDADTTELYTTDTAAAAAAAAGIKLSSWFWLFGSTNKKVFEKTYLQIVEPILQQGGTTSIVDERRFVSDAFQYHPQTNEKIWFELAHRFHWTSLPSELLADFKHTKNPWILAKAAKEATSSLWKQLRWSGSRSSLQRQHHEPETITVAFGDGTPISWWEMHQIRKAIKHNVARPPWKPGDFLVVDGLSMGLQ